MKYINQINLVLVVIAAAVVVYAFGRTYFAPPPVYTPSQSALPFESGPESNRSSSELESVPSPRLPGPSRPSQSPPRTRSRGAEGFTTPQNPPPGAVRTPQSGTAGGPRIITPRSATPGGTRPRTPVRATIRPADPESAPVPGEDQEDRETAPQDPPDLRRGNRRGGASPPPAQSSAPDRRRP